MLTVLLATHNGMDTLGRTLEQFCALVPPAGGWKLLVVNNASTDNTEELVLSFRGRLPLEYLVEPRLGKPYALNTGLQHISGDLVVFTDDDVLPDPDWLAAWRSAVDRHPECAIFGGTIDPLYERDPPSWLSGAPGWESILFGRTEPVPEGPVPPDGRNVYGPNMAIRTALLDSRSRYDTRFFSGPSGLMGEETEFVRRLADRATEPCFVPSARVRHIVQCGQLTWSYALRRFYRFGKRYWVLETREAPAVAQLFRMPRYVVRQIITLIAMTPVALLSFDRSRVFGHLRKLAFQLGLLVQARALQADARWRDWTAPCPPGSLAADRGERSH